MIRLYKDGQELLENNKAFLDTNPYLAVFFYWDAPLLSGHDKVNYAMRCEEGDRALLALKIEPFNFLLFGDPTLAEELFDFIIKEGYEVKNYFCSKEIGDEATRVLKKFGLNYEETLPMDFMEATEVTEPSSDDVSVATEADLNEIVDCMKQFIIDCGLADQVYPEKILESIGQYRLIKIDGRIAAMAKFVRGTVNDMRIMDVYTRNEFRGQGLAGKLVTTVKNEILATGSVATLNVDRRNPVTNHLYRRIGFKPLFSQGEYRKAE